MGDYSCVACRKRVFNILVEPIVSHHNPYTHLFNAHDDSFCGPGGLLLIRHRALGVAELGGAFPGMTPMQIMVAVAVHNKRPPTTSVEKQWGKPVVDLMRQLWAADPSARPSITHGRGVLLKLLDELCKRI